MSTVVVSITVVVLVESIKVLLSTQMANKLVAIKSIVTALVSLEKLAAQKQIVSTPGTPLHSGVWCLDCQCGDCDAHWMRSYRTPFCANSSLPSLREAFRSWRFISA
jgi:hypothetical protein